MEDLKPLCRKCKQGRIYAAKLCEKCYKRRVKQMDMGKMFKKDKEEFTL